MARAKKEEIKKRFTIKVKDNPNCCEIGAGGVHFAHGQAEMDDCQLLNWFREHEGYEVTEVAAEPVAEGEVEKEAEKEAEK